MKYAVLSASIDEKNTFLVFVTFQANIDYVKRYCQRNIRIDFELLKINLIDIFI